MPTVLKIFIAYSRRDESLLDELRLHFTPLERSKRVEIWYDGKIEPGIIWEQAIKDHLHKANIILLLVSASAIASDYFYEKEVKDALDRHEKGTARVVPFILRPCAWRATLLAKLQALPKDGKPVTSWPDRDAAYSSAVNRIWEMVKDHEEKHKAEEAERLREEAAIRAELAAEAKRQKAEQENNERLAAFKLENKRKEEAAAAIVRKKIELAATEKARKETLRKEKAKQQARQRQVLVSQSSNILKSPILWVVLSLVLLGLVWMNPWKRVNKTANLPLDQELQAKDTETQAFNDVASLLSHEGSEAKPTVTPTYGNASNETAKIKSEVKHTVTPIFNDTVEQEDTQETYKTYLFNAQSLLSDNKYAEAKAAFQRAETFAEINQLDSKEAQQGISDSQSGLERQTKAQSEAEKEKQYQMWKEKGDNAYEGKFYSGAKDYYETAATYSNTKEVKRLINICNQKLKDLADAAEIAKIKEKERLAAIIQKEKELEAKKQSKIETQKKQQSEAINQLPTAIRNLETNMAILPSGKFTMGCTSEQRNECDDDEKYTQEIIISHFRMGKYEVTQEEWRAVMGNDPSRFKNCDRCPVEGVSWNEVQEFIEKLNELTGKRYRLPSEAEWEYAARGGESYKYAGSNDIGKVAWYVGNSGKKTNKVGSKRVSNGYGLYDMTGNVWEWCQDKYHDSYEGGPTTGKAWESGNGSDRVIRGGSWDYYAEYCRLSYRDGYSPGDRNHDLGFRLALSL